jgi:hypothetical protein
LEKYPDSDPRRKTFSLTHIFEIHFPPHPQLLPDGEEDYRDQREKAERIMDDKAETPS